MRNHWKCESVWNQQARLIAGLATLVGLISLSIAAPVPTTIEDFFLPGTQPETINHPIADGNNCAACHSVPDHDFDPTE